MNDQSMRAGLARSQVDTDWLIEGLTDMPESDVRELALWFGVPVHVAQGIVWLTEMRDREQPR